MSVPFGFIPTVLSAASIILMLADADNISTPSTIIGLLGLLASSVTVLLGLVVKWLLSENTAARKAAEDAWKASAEYLKYCNEQIVLARGRADDAINAERQLAQSAIKDNAQIAAALQAMSDRLPGSCSIHPAAKTEEGITLKRGEGL